MQICLAAGFENLAEQTRLFIRLWCLKEAYIKATGRGILAPPGLRAFTFELLLNIKVNPYTPHPHPHPLARRQKAFALFHHQPCTVEVDLIIVLCFETNHIIYNLGFNFDLASH